MKKNLLVMLAGVLAITFSAFTTQRPPTIAYYWNGSSYVQVPAGTFICDEGSVEQCRSTVNGTANVPLFKDAVGTQLIRN